MKPTKTLFVINFDPINTRTRDLEKHFDQYGKIANIRIRRNFAFVQYESQEDATKALDGTNGRYTHFLLACAYKEYSNSYILFAASHRSEERRVGKECRL